MDLSARLLKTLRDIHHLVHPSQINLHDAEYLCNLRLVEAGAGTNYRITAKGVQRLEWEP